MKVAVVGATGMVGEVMLKVLAERNFPLTELIPVASERSVGKEIDFKGKKYKVVGMQTAVDMKADIALFSAGGETSLEWAPKFAAAGTTVIDNSSAWRMDPTKKLVVPEINASLLTKEDKIIANPNCSTIQMVLVLNPLHKKYNIKRVIVSTYQSITGTGVKAVQQLENEYAGIQGEMAYKYPIHRNAIPQCDSFEENGYTKEEMKLVRETQKIIGDKTIAVTATAVRVPIVGGHSEAVNVEFENDFARCNFTGRVLRGLGAFGAVASHGSLDAHEAIAGWTWCPAGRSAASTDDHAKRGCPRDSRHVLSASHGRAMPAVD